MIWLWTIVGAVLVGMALRLLAITKTHMTKLQAKYQADFFARANEFADSQELQDSRLETLSELSSALRSRKTQFLVLAAIERGIKEEKRVASGGKPAVASKSDHHADMTPEQQKLWYRLYFRWMAAVCTQGSLIGVASLVKLLEFFDPDDPGKSKAAISSLNLQSIAAH